METKRPESISSIVTGLIGSISVVFFILFLALSAGSGGNIGRVITGFSFLIMIIGFFAMGYGIRFFRDKNFSGISRWFGLIMPIAGSVLWLGLYLVGLLFG